MFEHWFLAGAFYLAILAFFDVRNKMRVDARPNYIMLGLTLGLFALKTTSFWFVVGALLGVFINYYVLKRFFSGVIGHADIVALSWIWLGWMIIALPYFYVFTALLLFSVIVLYFLKRLFKLERVAFFPSLFLCFVSTALLHEILWFTHGVRLL